MILLKQEEQEKADKVSDGKLLNSQYQNVVGMGLKNLH
jgi:hypothetical protein